MISIHTVKGSVKTSLHDFTVEQVDMKLIIYGTYYTQSEIIKFIDELHAGTEIVIDTPLVDTHYEIWLNSDGIVVLNRNDSQEFGKVINPIDRLAWFTVPANTTSLNEITIHTVVMQDEGN